jgi:hypothetical protein
MLISGFDRVVDMIPREVYSAQEDDTANQSWVCRTCSFTGNLPAFVDGHAWLQNKYGHKTKKQAVSRQKKSYDPDSTAAAAQPAVVSIVLATVVVPVPILRTLTNAGSSACGGSAVLGRDISVILELSTYVCERPVASDPSHSR